MIRFRTISRFSVWTREHGLGAAWERSGEALARATGFSPGPLPAIPPSPRSARRDAHLGARPAGVERLAGLVQVDDQGRVVRGGRLALARLAVDLRPDHAIGRRARREQMVDAHADVAIEMTRPIIPPRIAPRLRMP